MGRHHNKKYGVTSASTGRVHTRMQQRRLAKQGVPAPMAIGMSKFGMAPLGLIGLVGAGLLGYKFLSKKSFNKTIIPTTGLATTGLATSGIVNGIASAGVSRVSPTLKERMGFTGHYPKVGIMGFVKGLKNKALYGTPYMIKAPVVPINSFKQVW